MIIHSLIIGAVMILKVFSVYDSKVEVYFPPFMLKNKGEALRGMMELVTDGKSNISKYPEDFTLFELGSFDDSTAKFDLLLTPLSVCKAIECRPVS
jgi:hypothetical protein